MSRAQQQQVNTEATNLLNTENLNANTAKNLIMPGWSAMLANPGLTPAQQNAHTQATEGGIGAAFGSASEGAANRAARTNNAAGLTANEDALARQRMITSGNVAAQNQEYFTNAERADRLNALGGLSQLFGQNLSGANQTLGTQAGNARTPGFWDTLGQSFAGALGKGLVPSFDIGGASFG